MGSRTTIRLDVAPREQVGMKQVEFSLNHPVPYRHVEQLGLSTLVVGPDAHCVMDEQWNLVARW